MIILYYGELTINGKTFKFNTPTRNQEYINMFKEILSQ